MKFEPVQRKRIYEDIVNQILSQINKGILNPGDRLPSEREMASLMNTSRNSVSEAYRTLEVSGFVEIRPGGGAFVKEIDYQNFFKPFSDMISEDDMLILDTLEARDLIEVENAKMAARKASDEELDNLKKIVGQSKNAIDNGENGVKFDDEFHLAIAKASHNRVLSMVMQLINDSLSTSREATMKIDGQPAKTVCDHEEILNAIVSGDSEKAGIAMKKHLKKAKNNIVSQINGKKEKS